MPREPEMKKFGPPRTYKQIKQLCKEQGLTLDDYNYRVRFMDHITVSGGGCTVVYNTFNGRFSGKTPDGKDFFSSSTKYENEPWFQGLLSFFYTPRAVPTKIDNAVAEGLKIHAKMLDKKPVASAVTIAEAPHSRSANDGKKIPARKAVFK